MIAVGKCDFFGSFSNCQFCRLFKLSAWFKKASYKEAFCFSALGS
jgi:hypothetical protein